jgi:hypothetical protein
MNYAEMVAFFGGPSKIADALGIDDRQTVQSWSGRRRVPTRWQLKAEVVSRGALVADERARDEAKEMALYLQQARAVS